MADRRPADKTTGRGSVGRTWRSPQSRAEIRQSVSRRNVADTGAAPLSVLSSLPSPCFSHSSPTPPPSSTPPPPSSRTSPLSRQVPSLCSLQTAGCGRCSVQTPGAAGSRTCRGGFSAGTAACERWTAVAEPCSPLPMGVPQPHATVDACGASIVALSGIHGWMS